MSNNTNIVRSTITWVFTQKYLQSQKRESESWKMIEMKKDIKWTFCVSGKLSLSMCVRVISGDFSANILDFYMKYIFFKTIYLVLYMKYIFFKTKKLTLLFMFPCMFQATVPFFEIVDRGPTQRAPQFTETTHVKRKVKTQIWTALKFWVKELLISRWWMVIKKLVLFVEHWRLSVRKCYWCE